MNMGLITGQEKTPVHYLGSTEVGTKMFYVEKG